MAYCTITEVNALISKYVTGDSTTPTTTQAEVLTELVYGKINTVLASMGYTVPVTTPESFVSALKLLNIQGAAAMILMSMFPGATGQDSTPMWKSLHDIYLKGLKDLQNGEVPSSLGRAGETLGAGSLYTASNTDRDNYPDPKFSMSPSVKEF
jgi:hypothetical protein